ncbi:MULTISPECIES: cytochrome P450 [Mycolicibacterium]|uniref:Cytochrome P450 n=2 Tax=Mycolicibacterium gilvum TaxID=1804 RepID=A0A378SQR8_9MYCO|nr:MULTISPECIES: cytochrome P450 [Mycolicibacterium]ABP45852.1 cytochrome P450 [Mycolicibacterium gilvum PYR-GCK]MBV5243533.1 cytochrome P450 [Mycolicibacterium sp. PAM1]MCV7054635.1 cytochrome P450 [Mycolicibacterium gilvum]STZ43757.1 cytochrome P450 [Mycolicibacterium gilvum]
MATATTDPVRLPPGPRFPKLIQGGAVLAFRYGSVAALGRRYGSTFTLQLPVFGETVVISDPVLVKDLFSTSRELVGRPQNNLGGDVLGPGSIFNLEGDELLARRKLLLPPFNGKNMRAYEDITEQEVIREMQSWPEGVEFETLEPMMRITLNTILRAVFGAKGDELDELRVVIPAAVEFGSKIALLPSVVRKDLGAWSPGGKFARYRRRMDEICTQLIADARSDPDFTDRGDVLSLLLQARYDNGDPIPDAFVVDELLTMLVAGHETTSTQLAWTIERIRRHPDLLARLSDEVDAGGNELMAATIAESQRTRPVLTAALRRARTRIRLGEWVIPEGDTIMASTQLAMAAEQSFPDAEKFNPDRFVGNPPNPFAWIPFGGGMMRCIGASFATMEMDVTLRTMLREFRLEPTDEPDEKPHSRGVTVTPGRGGRAVVRRRRTPASGDANSVSVAETSR